MTLSEIRALLLAPINWLLYLTVPVWGGTMLFVLLTRALVRMDGEWRAIMLGKRFFLTGSGSMFE